MKKNLFPYGNRPDGSDKNWDNETHPNVNIEEVSFVYLIADHIYEECEEDEYLWAVTNGLFKHYHLSPHEKNLSKYLKLENCQTRRILEILTEKDESKLEVRGNKLLLDMQTISEIIMKNNISPTYLKERLSTIASKGAIWPVEIFTILEMAIARSPSGKWY